MGKGSNIACVLKVHKEKGIERLKIQEIEEKLGALREWVGISKPLHELNLLVLAIPFFNLSVVHSIFAHK